MATCEAVLIRKLWVPPNLVQPLVPSELAEGLGNSGFIGTIAARLKDFVFGDNEFRLRVDKPRLGPVHNKELP